MNNRYEHYLTCLKGRVAPSTLVRVRYTLKQLLQWLKKNNVTQWYEVTAEHLQKWVAEKAAKVAPMTLYDYKQEVAKFLTWLYREGYLLVNPWPKELDGKRPAYRMRKVPNVEQANKVLAVVDGGRNHRRNTAILEVAYGCGLRRQELQRLNISDVRDEWLRILGKGEKERLVPLGKQARRAVLSYMATERAYYLKNPHEQALFLSCYGRRLGVDSFGYILKREKLNKITTLHGLRHACATHMLRNGANIRTLQKLLGHSKLSSTQIYTELDTTDIAKMLNWYHPRG